MAINTEGHLSAYDRWLEKQREEDLAAMARQAELERPTLTQPFSSHEADGLSLEAPKLSIDPQFDPAPAANNFQLEKPAMIQGADVAAGGGASSGTMAGAGIAAAGQAVSIIAQLAGAQAAKEAALGQNTANRSSTEKMARAALLQNQSQFDSSSQMNAYQAMLAALGAAGNQQMQQRSLKRANSKNQSDAYTTAYLGA
jgi:hypothetical protein